MRGVKVKRIRSRSFSCLLIRNPVTEAMGRVPKTFFASPVSFFILIEKQDSLHREDESSYLILKGHTHVAGFTVPQSHPYRF